MKRRTVIPKNVLAQESLRRKYLEEPWPQKLILVKNNVDSGEVRVRGSKTGLLYSLSYPYLYIDERDLDGLGDMVAKDKVPDKVATKVAPKAKEKYKKKMENVAVVAGITKVAGITESVVTETTVTEVEVTEAEVAEAVITNEETISGDKDNLSGENYPTDTIGTEPVRKKARERGRPRKNSRSSGDDLPNSE